MTQTPTEQAIEHLRTTIITARAVDATQAVITINDLATALDEIDRLRTALTDEIQTSKDLETETTRATVMGW